MKALVEQQQHKGLGLSSTAARERWRRCKKMDAAAQCQHTRVHYTRSYVSRRQSLPTAEVV